MIFLDWTISTRLQEHQALGTQTYLFNVAARVVITMAPDPAGIPVERPARISHEAA